MVKMDLSEERTWDGAYEVRGEDRVSQVPVPFCEMTSTLVLFSPSYHTLYFRVPELETTRTQV